MEPPEWQTLQGNARKLRGHFLNKHVCLKEVNDSRHRFSDQLYLFDCGFTRKLQVG